MGKASREGMLCRRGLGCNLGELMLLGVCKGLIVPMQTHMEITLSLIRTGIWVGAPCVDKGSGDVSVWV